jgi:hypothetical protein
MPAEYAKHAEDVIIEVLKDNLGKKFKDYYFGDPVFIPSSSMPCIIVDRERTQYEQRTTAHDERTIIVTIRVVLNKKSDLNRPGKEATTKRLLMDLIEGEDESTDEVSQESILGILRKNYTLGSYVVSAIHSIQYFGLTERGREIASEADITVELQRLTIVSNRV